MRMQEYRLRREVQSLISKVRMGEEKEDVLRLAGKKEADEFRDYVEQCVAEIGKRRYAEHHNLQYIDTDQFEGANKCGGWGGEGGSLLRSFL